MTRLRLSLDATSVPVNPTGAGRYVLDLAAALARRDDVELLVVTRSGDLDRWRGDRWQGDRWQGDRWQEIASGPLDRAPLRRLARLVWEQARLPALLAELGPDVHHAPHYTMPERASVPTVVTVHDLTFFDHPEWHQRAKGLLFRRAIRVAAARADALVCVSEATASRLEDRFAPTVPVHVIPHGLDHRRYRPTDEPRQAGAAPYVAFLGTLEPRKGLPTLVAAFDRVAGRRPDLTLLLAGPQGWSSGYRQAVAASPHRSRIRHVGYIPDDEVAGFLGRAAAVAYPSLEEGFGLPVLEAMACGAPVVTTAGSPMAEVTGEAGLLVPPGDADALAGALEALVAGGPEVAARRRRGIELAARYTWEASAAAHMAVYRSLA